MYPQITDIWIRDYCSGCFELILLEGMFYTWASKIPLQECSITDVFSQCRIFLSEKPKDYLHKLLRCIEHCVQEHVQLWITNLLDGYSLSFDKAIRLDFRLSSDGVVEHSNRTPYLIGRQIVEAVFLLPCLPLMKTLPAKDRESKESKSPFY